MLGHGWTSDYSKRLAIGSSNILTVRNNGSSVLFTTLGDGLWTSDIHSKSTLVENGNGFVLTFLNTNSKEQYDLEGKLLFEEDRAGNTTSYHYTGNLLTKVTGPFGHELNFSYNNLNLIESLTLPSGSSILYSYDGNQNLIRTDYPDGTSKTYHYEDTQPGFESLLTGISDQNGVRSATWAYDSGRKATLSEHAETDNGAPQEQFQLDYESDLTTNITLPNGSIDEYVFSTEKYGVKPLVSKTNLTDSIGFTNYYDSNRNISRHVDELGQYTDYTYNSHNQRTSKTVGVNSPGEVTTSYQYYSEDVDLITEESKPSVASGELYKKTVIYDDTLLLPTSITHSGYQPDATPISKETNITYNNLGQVTTVDGPRTDVDDSYHFTYYNCNTGSECGNVKTISNPLGQTTSYDAYNADGKVTKITAINGMVSEFTYDDMGRILTSKETGADGQERLSAYTYNALGLAETFNDANGKVLTYAYDDAHYLRTITDNLGNQISYHYDLSGNRDKEEVKDSSGDIVKSISFEHDLRNRLSQVSIGSQISQYVFDALGRLTSASDGNENTEQFSYDFIGRLETATDALNGVTQNSYSHLNDHPDQVVSPNGATTGYVVDDFGQVISEDSPDRGTLLYTYDSAGNRVSTTDPRAITIQRQYDALNRLVFVDTPTDPMAVDEDITYVYGNCLNGVGKTCQRTDATGTASFEYDSLGRLSSKTDSIFGVAYTRHYTYDALGLVTSLQYSDGLTVHYGRDAVGRITSINATGSTSYPIINSATYTADSLLSTIGWGNGLVETRQYSAERYLSDWSVDSVYAQQLTYDSAGNVLSRSLSDQTQQFSYDALNRLTADSLDQHSFTYDANGNRLSKTRSGNQSSYLYAANSNQLASINGEAVLTTATGSISNVGSKEMSYNSLDRLSSISYPKDGVTVSTDYRYNGSGQRTVKSNNAEQVIYHYDEQGQLIEETEADGTPIKQYIWLGSTPVAQIEHSSSAVTYIHTDHLTTPRAGTDAAGQLVWLWESDAFGEETPQNDPDGDGSETVVNLRFPGQYYDEESGLYYNYFRDYDPSTGRYMQSDPIGLAGGINTYLYANANPLSFTDPTGENPATGAMWGGNIGTAIGTPLGGPVGAAIGRAIGSGIGAGIGYGIAKMCEDDDDDFCYKRWEQEDSRCWQWKGLGMRVVKACQSRAAYRRNLCNGNGGKPDPSEPPEYDPFVDYPR